MQLTVDLVSGKTQSVAIVTNDLYSTGFVRTKTFGIRCDVIASLNVIRDVDGSEYVEMTFRNLSTTYSFVLEILPLTAETFKGKYPISQVAGAVPSSIDDLCNKLRALIFT